MYKNLEYFLTGRSEKYEEVNKNNDKIMGKKKWGERKRREQNNGRREGMKDRTKAKKREQAINQKKDWRRKKKDRERKINWQKKKNLNAFSSASIIPSLRQEAEARRTKG